MNSPPPKVGFSQQQQKVRKLAAVLVLGQALLLGACASGPPLHDYTLPAASVELSATPFHAQADYQCGPAALATVLGASGATVTPEELTTQVYLPGRRGSIQAEMVAATRRHHRVPYVLQPKMQSLLDEIAAGTPVLVLQNLGLKAVPQWHYAVVIGYDTAADSLLLRSGTHKRLRMTRHRFESSWARAQRWALVAAMPEQPPVTANSSDWLQAASAFEELGQPAQAAAAYAAATRRWPEQPLAWQALANAYYALHDLPAAEAALRSALQHSASAAAHNNLAQVLLERGCPAAAATAIGNAETAADAAAFAGVLARTRAAIESFAGHAATDCPL